MKHLKRFEDVYWGSKDILESDKEREERILKWVENYVDEEVGLDIMNVSVTEKTIGVHYKKGHRYEDRKPGRMRGGMSPEEAKKAMKDDWYQMGLDMVDEMRLGYMEGYKDGLGLDLDGEFYIRANENGYFIEAYEEFPREKTGSSPLGFGG